MNAAPAEGLVAKTARRFRAQSQGCGLMGSDLYREVLARAADDIEAGGPVWEVLEPYAGDPGGTVLALRLMGATHRLALTGRAPDLAARYPSAGGDGDPVGAWKAWIALVRDRPDEVGPLVAHGVQTNEVGRSAALIGGFLAVARRTGLALRILEVGASAGLNLRWDKFHYRAGSQGWGPAGAPVDLADPFIGPVIPQLSPARVDVVERRGCDVSPVDASTADGRVTLLSYVWPDQVRRFQNLAGACDVAAELPVPVDRASADVWVAEQLAPRRAGMATVVFHSVMLQYVEPGARARLLQEIAAAGVAASPAGPLAWLRMEPVRLTDPDMEVRLTTWPGGEDHRLAVAHPHGSWVRWAEHGGE